jgi:MFS family permease
MIAAILSCWALLLGLGLLMLGNGLQGTLLGLRASLEGFPTATTGVVMTGYFAGYVVGSILVPRLVSNVGHVRVFAALAALASAGVILHPIFVLPGPWFAIRVVTGFCFAGLFLITESWLNDIATNQTRGQILSVYMVIVMGSMGLGQLLLNVADPRGVELFVLICVLVSVAVVPMLLSAGRTPEFSTPESISLKRLYQASPLGIVGSFSTGLIQGSVFGMGAVFANGMNLSVAQVSWFMTAFGLGGMLLQWPVGRLSDSMDRRKVIVGATAVSTVAALSAIFAGQHSVTMLITMMAVYGALSMPLYSLFIANTNDHLESRQRVAASGSLVMVGGLGAVLGPTLCATVMDTFGTPAFFAFLASIHAAVTIFGVWRMFQRESLPADQQHAYASVPPRATAIAAGIASRTVRDARDRDLARWSDL